MEEKIVEVGMLLDKDIEYYNSIIEKLNTKDEFELMKYVRFLCAYGDKKAVTNLLAILETTTTAENIAGEIPYLMPFLQLLSTSVLCWKTVLFYNKLL